MKGGPSESNRVHPRDIVTAGLTAIVFLISGCAALQGPEIIYPPNAPRVLSHYGSFRGPGGGIRGSPHRGIDIEAKTGELVLAAAEGTVWSAGWTDGAEYRISIAHGRDADSNYVMTIYFHNSQNLVEKGQKVKRGQAIALPGSTGRTGFTHFGVMRGSTREYPKDWSDIDPHEYWVDGPYRITCFDPTRSYPSSPIRFTYPVECK
ncbi:MAG: M23 family metallopeptidase [Candidatus Binatota bacterium]